MSESLLTAQSILWMIEQVKNHGGFEYADWAREFRSRGSDLTPRTDRKFLNHLKVFREQALSLFQGAREITLEARRGRYVLEGAVSDAAWERITDPAGKNFLPILQAISARRDFVPIPASELQKRLLDLFDVPPETLGRILYKNAVTWRFDPAYLDTFLNAVQSGTKLFIRPIGERKAGYVTPLFLVNYEGSWHLLAYRNGLAQYNLSRVAAMTNCDYSAEAITPTQWQLLRASAQQSFGIHLVDDWDNLSEGEPVTIRYRGRALPYVRERFDARQRQRSDSWFVTEAGPGWVDVTVKVHAYTDMITEAIRWGRDAEAIQPAEFREVWLEHIRELAEFLG